ncbi:MAG: hypothetical protein JXR84_09810 [Anaerolineae bacterium]|nr:hypothetical protein [Anaerolineae bacterium]
MEESIFVVDKVGSYHKVDYYCVVGDFWIYEQEVATQLVQYQEPEGGKIYAEVLTAESPKIGRFELLFENPNDITKERKVFVKLNPSGSSMKNTT